MNEPVVCRCCTVNHPQGWPKFITNAFVTSPDQKSLVHVYLGPYSVNASLANGTGVGHRLRFINLSVAGSRIQMLTAAI